MAEGQNKGDERQRFHVELTFGETTIISWKKLLKEARKKKEGQCPLPSSGPQPSSSAVAPETLRKTMEISYDAGQCNDTVIGNKRAKHLAMSLDQIQQGKHKVEMPKNEGEKYDVDSSNKLAGLLEMNTKVISKTKDTLEHINSPAMVKNHPLEKLRGTMVNVLTYSRKPAEFRSKSKGPPLDAVEDICGLPSKTMHNVVQKNQRVSSKKSGMKVGVGCSSYDNVMHQKMEGYFPGSSYDNVMHQKMEGYFPLMINSTSGMLLRDDASSKTQHTEKSGRSRELLDALPPCYRSALKDSKAEKFKEIKNEIFAMVLNQPIDVKIPKTKEKWFANAYNLDVKMEDKLCDLYELCFQGLAGDKDVEVQKLYVEVAELWPKGVMDLQKLTEAINRAKRRRAISAKNQGQNLMDTVKIKHVRPPCQKRKVIDSSNNCNSIPSFTGKNTPKKAAKEQPALQCNSSDSHSLTKAGKLILKQKPLVPPMTDVKVRFLMKQEHEALKPDEKAVNDVLNQSSIGASATCNNGRFDMPHP